MNNKKLTLSVFFIFTITVAAISQQVTVRQLPGTGIETAGNTIHDHAGNVIIWGSFTQTLDFDPSSATYNLTAANPNNDGFAAKYDAGGALLWAVDFASNSYGVTNAVDVDKDNNVYITGAFTGTIDADPSAASNIFTSAGDVDFFITKLSPSGNYLWAKHIGGTGTDQADDIKTNELSSFYISGIFSNTVDFDPSGGVSNLTTTFPGTINEVNRTFIAKYDLDGNLLWAENVGGRGGSMFVNKNSTTNDYVLLAGGGSAYNTTAEDFDPGANTVSPVPPPLPGANYAVIAKYTSTGKYVWSDFFRTFLSMNVSAGPWFCESDTGCIQKYLCRRFFCNQLCRLPG